MEDRFQQWIKLKRRISDSKKLPYFYEREIWMIYIGGNVGMEQNGKGDLFLRPVLIFRKFGKYSFLGIPLTSKEKLGKLYHEFRWGKNKRNFCCLAQLRAFDSRRLKYRMGKISVENFREIQKKVFEVENLSIIDPEKIQGGKP